MQDRRQSVRDKVFYGAVAEINERGSTRDCVVRNISEGGACVEFGDAARLPEEMNLSIARKGRSFLARLIWRQANKVGPRLPDHDLGHAGERSRRTGPPQRDQEAAIAATHQGIAGPKLNQG